MTGETKMPEREPDRGVTIRVTDKPSGQELLHAELMLWVDGPPNKLRSYQQTKIIRRDAAMDNELLSEALRGLFEVDELDELG